jgi:SNF2 family DNA or RNA helicase
MLDMGLGKTVSTLTAITELMHDYFDVQKVLVIAPLRVADSTWTDEAARWKHTRYLKMAKVLGSEAKRVQALNEKAHVYIINRENVAWLVEYYGRKWDFDMIVIDESSSFKSHAARRFKELKKVRPRAKRVVELTGTPAPNGIMDLWSQIYLLDRGKRLGKNITSFRKKYFDQGRANGHIVYDWVPKENAEREIYKKIADISVSMKSEDYLSLPRVTRNFIKVKLSDDVVKRYRKFEREYILQVANSDIVASSAASLSNKLLQLANGAVYDDEKNVISIHSEKLETLAELADTNAHKSMMVMYWYKHDLERLKKRFPRARALESSEDIRDWNDSKIELLLVHPASAGHGLNLQYGGSIIVWFGLTWSLELYQQANKRLHRHGQKENVIIHHLIAEGTIDEDVMKALEEKNIGQEKMLEAVKARIEKLKTT